MMSTPLEEMAPRQSPQSSHGGPQYGQMARHLSAGHIPGMESQLSAGHLPSHASLQQMESLAHHSGRMQDSGMGSHMVRP